MLKKYWNEIRRVLAVALSASLLAGTMTMSASLPTAAASGSRVETDAKGGVTITLDGREVWQAASAAMQKADAVTGDIADRIMAQTGSNGNPVVLEDEIYKMDLPTKALKGLPTGLGMDMYISAGAEDAAEDYTAAEEEEAAAVTAEVSSASDLAHAATGVAERPVRDFFASNMFSLVSENDDSALVGTAAAAGGEGYELNGSEHIYFVLSNATDQDVNYTIKMGGMELLKTKVLKSHGSTGGVIGATVSSLVGIPDSTSGMTRATGSDMATASGLMGETELTDDVVAKVVRTTLKNFFVIYRSDETDLGTRVMVVTTADAKFKAEGGGLLSGRTEKPVLHVEDVLKGTKKYEDTEKALRDNDVVHADFAAVDISFRKSVGGTEDYEPYEGQIVNVRIESRAMEGFDPDGISIQHHLEDGTLETVAGTTRKTKQTVIEINDETADEAVTGTTTVTEDNQTEVTVESDNDGNVYTFDEDANRALMQKQLNRAKSKSSFRMSVGSGETRLENDTESENGAPKKTTSAKTAAKTANNTSTATTVSSNVDANGVKTEVREEKGKGGLKVENGRVIADFVVDSFSIYSIVGTGEFARRTYNFIADGEIVNTQIVKSGEELIEYEIPDLTANQEFVGWYTDSDYTTPAVFGVIADEITADETVNLYAKINTTYYVTFYDEDLTSVLETKKANAENEYTVILSDVEAVSSDNTTRFYGWSEDRTTAITEDEITISEDKALYPIFKPGYWLFFDENDGGTGGGATYTPPEYVFSGETTKRPENDPERGGYTFGGWYTTAACVTPFTFGQEIGSDTTAYAKWNAADSSYTIDIWKQKVTDDVDASDAEKTYDFEASVTIHANTGTRTNLATALRNYNQFGNEEEVHIGNEVYNFVGFHFSRADDNTTVNADKSTVINVYYDRNIIGITFDYPEDVTQYSNTPVYVESENGDYYYYNDPNESGFYEGGEGPTPNARLTHHQSLIIPGLYTRLQLIYIPFVGWFPEHTHYYYTNISGYYRVGTGPDPSAEGTHTIQNIRAKTDYPDDETWRGLFAAAFEKPWPSTYEVIYTEENGTTRTETIRTNWQYTKDYGDEGSSSTIMTYMSDYILGTPTDTSVVYTPTTGSPGSIPIYFYKEKLDGSYGDTSNPDGQTISSGGTFMITDKYMGHHAVSYRVNGSGDWISVSEPDDDGVYARVPANSYQQLEIRFARTIYNLDFMNGGETAEIKHIPYRDSLSEITAPAVEYPGPPSDKDHYTLVGWFTDSACTNIAFFEEPTAEELARLQSDWGITKYTVLSTMPANNINLYAGWFKNWYNVTLDFNGGTIPQGASDDFWVQHGNTVSGELLNQTTRDGYILVGWHVDTEDGEPWSFSTKVTEPLHLVAKWRTSNTIKVIYDAAEGQNPPTDSHAYIDSANAEILGEPVAPEGKYFVGWLFKDVKYYPGDVLKVHEADTQMVDSVKAIVLVAQYTELTDTTLTFDANGGTISGISEVTDESVKPNIGLTETQVQITKLPLNQEFTAYGADNFKRVGYKLLGWSFTSSAAEPEFLPGSSIGADNKNREGNNTNSNTLYAVWEKVPVLTVKKVVTGNMGSKAKDFNFTLTVNTANVEPVFETERTDKPAKNGSTYTFKLAKDDELKISMDKNTEYILVEEDANKFGYTTTYSTGYAADGMTLTEDMTITVTNHRDVTVPTGINTDLHFWKWLIGACFLALIGAAMYGRKKRRM